MFFNTIANGKMRKNFLTFYLLFVILSDNIIARADEDVRRKRYPKRISIRIFLQHKDNIKESEDKDYNVCVFYSGFWRDNVGNISR